jgi:hypothetical protein
MKRLISIIKVFFQSLKKAKKAADEIETLAQLIEKEEVHVNRPEHPMCRSSAKPMFKTEETPGVPFSDQTVDTHEAMRRFNDMFFGEATLSIGDHKDMNIHDIRYSAAPENYGKSKKWTSDDIIDANLEIKELLGE